jgi:hypothetical protein
MTVLMAYSISRIIVACEKTQQMIRPLPDPQSGNSRSLFSFSFFFTREGFLETLFFEDEFNENLLTLNEVDLEK